MRASHARKTCFRYFRRYIVIRESLQAHSTLVFSASVRRSILPFTSATASLCAATTVAVVELLPIIPSVLAQSLTMAAFPLFGSLVAAAASVSKARCEVDAEAATAAANELSRTDGSDQINPVESTLELVRLSVLPYLESTSLGKRLPKQLLRRG